MSADNYQQITKEDGKFTLYYGCASNDWRKTIGTYDTLEEAIRASKERDTEYGLSFNLDEPTAPTNSLNT